MSSAEAATTPKTLVERFYAEIWNRGDEAVARAILAPDFRFRGSLGVTADDVDGFLAYVRSVRAALGDYRCTIDDLIENEDRAAARMTFTGVHRSELLGVDDKMKPIEGSEFSIPADLVLLAMGFLGPVQDGMVKDLQLDLDQRGNVLANVIDYRSSNDKVFSCGDMRRGQSLVVWAIREGRQCAHSVDKFLMGETTLPR